MNAEVKSEQQAKVEIKTEVSEVKPEITPPGERLPVTRVAGDPRVWRIIPRAPVPPEWDAGAPAAKRRQVGRATR
jgi:hypothetical protein